MFYIIKLFATVQGQGSRLESTPERAWEKKASHSHFKVSISILKHSFPCSVCFESMSQCMWGMSKNLDLHDNREVKENETAGSWGRRDYRMTLKGENLIRAQMVDYTKEIRLSSCPASSTHAQTLQYYFPGTQQFIPQIWAHHLHPNWRCGHT